MAQSDLRVRRKVIEQFEAVRPLASKAVHDNPAIRPAEENSPTMQDPLR
jgi:hypothetical protein